MSGPSGVVITNLTCRDERTLYLQWSRPPTVYNSVDQYYVYYTNDRDWAVEEVYGLETHSITFACYLFLVAYVD